MNLYLTINGKLVDFIPIDPLKRKDPQYLETKKEFLQQKNHITPKKSRQGIEFYVDPAFEPNVKNV